MIFEGMLSFSARQESHDDSGFSLLETLITLIIISLAGAIMSGFLVQLKQIDQQFERQSSHQNASAAINYLANVLSSAQNTPYRYNSKGAHEMFSGQSGKVIFTAPIRIRSNTYALRQVEYVLRSSDNTLRVKTSPILLDPNDRENETRSEIILINSTNLQFFYLNSSGDWLKKWPAGIRHPQAVKIQLTAGEFENKQFSFIAILENALPRRK